MEIVLISLYVAKNFNMFKTFLILDEEWYYLISTLNNKITIIRRCLAFEGSYIDIAKKLAFSDEAIMPYHVETMFNNNHKRMFKKVEIDWLEPQEELDIIHLYK